MTKTFELMPDGQTIVDDKGDAMPLVGSPDILLLSAEDVHDDATADYYEGLIAEEKLAERTSEETASIETAMAKRAILPYRYEEGEDAYSDLGGGLPGRDVEDDRHGETLEIPAPKAPKKLDYTTGPVAVRQAIADEKEEAARRATRSSESRRRFGIL